MPRLVVGMPAYNAESTVRRAVLSTLRAMPKDSRLVVFNDSSSDGTLAILDSIPDRRLSVINSPENVGGGNARKRLLAETDSEFFAAMDADDVTFPWRFSLQFKAAQTADVVFSAAVKFGGRRGRVRPSAPTALRTEEFVAALLFHNPVWHPTLFARRSVIDKVGGYRSERYAQDYELWLRVALAGTKMCRLGVPVIAYRESLGQVTKSADYIEKIRSFNEMRRSYIDLFNSRIESVSLEMNLTATAASERIDRGLREQLRIFRPLNRYQYSSFVRTHRSQDWLTRLFPEDSQTIQGH